MKDTLLKYCIGTVGLILVALGIALSIISNLGTAPLSCPAYVFEGIWGLSVGNWTIIVNTSYIIVQLLVMRNLFKVKYFLQIIASIILGYLIDGWLAAFAWLQPSALLPRAALLLASCCVGALGVSLEMFARAWMLSAEMTVYAFQKRCTMSFGNLKMIMDSTMVAISAVVAWFLYGNPFGHDAFVGIKDIVLGTSEGVVIGLGTLVSAFGIGFLMRYTDPLVAKHLPTLSQRWGV